MSIQTNTAAAGSLERAGKDIHWLLGTTEDAIGALVGAFQSLTSDTDTILKEAAAIVECVGSERVGSVLPSVHEMGVASKRFVGDRLDGTAGILETVNGEIELLRQLSRVTEGQAKIALEIKVLNVHTKVEVAHLGAVGIGFQYLAGELADFSNSLTENTEELTRHTEKRQTAIEKTRKMLSVELPQLREELICVESELANVLSSLESGLTSLSSTPAQFKHSAEELSAQIASVVVAFQGHDITRQQLEHVQEALELVASKMTAVPEGGEVGLDELAFAHAGLCIQAHQIRAIKSTISEWTSQVKNCMDSILRIGVSDLVGIGPMVLEQEQSMSSNLEHVEQLERQCQSYSEKIHGTLEGISGLSALVTDHLQKSQSARNRLRLLTFNSIVEASRLGSQADTICVIADGIAEVAARWSTITEQSGHALDGILGLSKKITEVVETFSQGGDTEMKEARMHALAALESLRSAASFAAAQGEKIEGVGKAMQARSVEVKKTSDLLDSCFGCLDELVEIIEDAKNQIEANHPNIEEFYDKELVESMYSAPYTTQAEREVLRVALYGAEMAMTEECSEGNSVELF